MARVLVVDDEIAFRDYLARKLQREGHRVRVAGSGEEAVHVCEQFAPNLVVVDFMLRGTESGVEVYRRIRQVHPQAKAVLITGFHSEEVQHEALRGGVAHIFNKPFALQDFADYVNDLFPEEEIRSAGKSDP